jgi:hypothetical protein
MVGKLPLADHGCFISEGRMNNDWHGPVYKRNNHKFNVRAWLITQKLIIERDNGRCKSCGTDKYLTVHHIIPRNEGGDEDFDNLITLCLDCHNEIEPLRLNKYQIIGFNLPPELPNSEREIDTTDWHAYVYGGMRHSDRSLIVK